METLDRTLLAAFALALGGFLTASLPLAAGGAGLLSIAGLVLLLPRLTNAEGKRTPSGLRTIEGGTLQNHMHATGRLLFPSLVQARDRLPKTAEPIPARPLETATGSFSIDQTMSLTFPVPGSARLGPLVLDVLDPLGLTKETHRLSDADVIRVWPRGEDLRDTPLRSRFEHIVTGTHAVRKPGDSLEFYRIREYLPGDKMKDVNWKASIRENNLLVNEYEHESRGELSLFIDNRLSSHVGTLRENLFHDVMRTAATLADVAWSERDILNAFAFGDAKPEAFQPDPGSSWMDQFMDWISSLEAAKDHDASVTFDAVLPHLTPRSMVVFVSSFVGETDPFGGAPIKAMALNNSVLVVASGLPDIEDPVIDVKVKRQRAHWMQHYKELGFEIVDMDREPSLQLALVHWKGAT